MLIFNLCYAPCSVQFLTYYAHVKDLCLNLTVLLEYIHLYHKNNFNMVTVLLEYIKILHTIYSYTNNNHGGLCSINIQSYYISFYIYIATYYAQNYAGIIGWSLYFSMHGQGLLYTKY